MSKLSFRARALDATKPLPVFRCEDLPDLHEYASINRAVPQMPTGMEKEEESEHHLQRAISAQQVYGEKRDNMHIPVPEAESDITYYESLYPGEFKMPKQLIHIQPFSLDAEQPDYDLDSEDDAFVNKLKKKMEISFLQFEEMIDRLEKGSGQQAVSLPEAKLLLKEDDELIKEVFDYWSRKRKTSRANCLIPNCKQERRDGSSTSDPYVAFRRRTEKMQTRKNRKNDEASYEKMLKLRRDLSRAVTILEMIKRREKSKRELLHLTLEIFEKRNVMSDYSGEYRHQDHMDLKDYKSKPEKAEVPRQKRKYEKKPKALPLSSGAPHHPGPAVFNAKDLNQYDFPSSDDEPYSQLHSGSSEAEEENDPDGAFAFRRKAGCQYYAVRQDRVGSWPWCGPWDGGLAEARFRYSLTTLTVPRRCLGMARRRMGRGGRVLLDRAHTDYDNVFHDLDAEKLDTSLPPSSPPPAASSRSPASDKKLSRSLKRPASSPTAAGQPFGSLRPGRVVHAPPPTAAFTAEQYQQHLEQLALMQKLQLEQVQLQLKANSTATTNSTKGLSHTLDQASAQFAASALVTADKLLALKTKEDLGPGGGAVNGVLSPSGVYKGSHLSSTAAPPSSSSPTPSLLRLGVPTGKRVHAPRTLSSTTMSTSALKLAAANCQKPKVTATSASPLDIVPRENHEQEKPALNSLSENTVAMEVT
ncbi:Enhancer of polycomb like 1 [Dissostichus eleginoides]|uniref:Enhancer of polycomb homolog n=1 Tax=Dissostichus eleginoides TaxID=100907 RepID=A0AAD9EQM6_DISEL|nr:Enhancer of polycomb like 1 [Dissostichus eleginoides]